MSSIRWPLPSQLRYSRRVWRTAALQHLTSLAGRTSWHTNGLWFSSRAEPTAAGNTVYTVLSALLQARRQLYSELLFGGLGTCESHPAVAHQYATSVTQDKRNVAVFDFIKYSCLNG
jgi:hypothetical protein